MESLSIHHRLQSLNLSINRRRLFVTKPISSINRRCLFVPKPMPIKIRASSSSSFSPSQGPLTPKNFIPSFPKTLNPVATAASIAAIAVAVFLFMRLKHKPTPIEEQVKQLEERLSEKPDDVESLRSLMEVKLKSNKLDEVVEALDRLIAIDLQVYEWKLLKANIHYYKGETELASIIFENILAQQPLNVEAYHGLAMCFGCSSNSKKKLEHLKNRISQAMEGCKKNEDMRRSFRMLLARIRVNEGEYEHALELYEELVREDPTDFRPYLYRGTVYTLLGNKTDAKLEFDTFRKLVPKYYPYRDEFDDLVTKMYG